LEESGEKIIDKLVEKALEGDPTALRVLGSIPVGPKN
jgi:hypothetical protein